MRTLAAVAVLLALVACQAPPPPMTAADQAQIEADVEQLVRGLYDAAAVINPEPWMAVLAEDAGFHVSGTNIRDIHEAFAGYGAEWTSDTPTRPVRMEFGEEQIRVVAVTPTVAYAVVTSQPRSWHLANGDVTRAGTAETWVFVLTDGGWKIHSTHLEMWPLEDRGTAEPE